MSIKNLNSDSFSSWIDIRADEVKCDSLVAFGAVGTPLINTDSTPLLLATNNNIGIELTQDNTPKTIIRGDLEVQGAMVSTNDTFINPTFVLPSNNSIGPTTTFITNPGNYTQINSIQSTMLGDSNNIVRQLTSPSLLNITANSINGISSIASTNTSQTLSNKIIDGTNTIKNGSGGNITFPGSSGGALLVDVGSSQSIANKALSNSLYLLGIDNNIGPNTYLVKDNNGTGVHNLVQVNSIQSTMLGDSNNIVRQFEDATFSNITVNEVRCNEGYIIMDTPNATPGNTVEISMRAGGVEKTRIILDADPSFPDTSIESSGAIKLNAVGDLIMTAVNTRVSNKLILSLVGVTVDNSVTDIVGMKTNGELVRKQNIVDTNSSQTLTNKIINSVNNTIQVNGTNINSYLSLRYFAPSQGITPGQQFSKKEYFGVALTNASGVATFYINSTGASGGTALFSNLAAAYFYCSARNNTTSAINVPIASINTVTSDTVTVNVIRGLTAVLASNTLQFVPANITVYLHVIGE